MSKNPNMARPKVTEKIRNKIMKANLGTLEEVRAFAAKLGLSISTVYRVRKARANIKPNFEDVKC